MVSVFNYFRSWLTLSWAPVIFEASTGMTSDGHEELSDYLSCTMNKTHKNLQTSLKPKKSLMSLHTHNDCCFLTRNLLPTGARGRYETPSLHMAIKLLSSSHTHISHHTWTQIPTTHTLLYPSPSLTPSVILWHLQLLQEQSEHLNISWNLWWIQSNIMSQHIYF